MMALFIDNCYDHSITLNDFRKFLGCRITRLLTYMTDIDELERRELIRRRNGISGKCYFVPADVLNAFKRDEKYVPRVVSNLTCRQLFDELDVLFDECEENDVPYRNLCEKLDRLLSANEQLAFVKRVKGYDLAWKENRALLVTLAHLFVNNEDDCVGCHDVRFIFEGEQSMWNRTRRGLENDENELYDMGLIEKTNANGMADIKFFHLTDKAKSELLEELDISSVSNSKKKHGVIAADKITAKTLYYGKRVESRVDELAGLLDEVKYQEVRSRLGDAGMRKGFTCLFYGGPGTGKTETVLQLARRSGRDIVQVNVTDIKSKWVGESEANIKAVFDSYRRRVSAGGKTPILLFNEADAVIGKRLEGAERAVEKMENSIQNIILQEMETLDGIMIATTNLEQNMDSAFERRFLYKLKFEKPSVEARASIWREMIPALSKEQAERLAEKYDFSGGQIENAARHYTIDSILHGASDDPLALIMSHCDEERLQGRKTARMGF